MIDIPDLKLENDMKKSRLAWVRDLAKAGLQYPGESGLEGFSAGWHEGFMAAVAASTPSETQQTRDAVLEALREYIAAADEYVHGDDVKAMLRFGEADKAARAILNAAPQGSKDSVGDGGRREGNRPHPAAAAPIQAHSKSEFKRLDAQGANVVPPVHTPPNTDAKDAARYRWLRDTGPSHIVYGTTASFSPGAGPYIKFDPPSMNSFSGLILHGQHADEQIDYCMKRTDQRHGG